MRERRYITLTEQQASTVLSEYDDGWNTNEQVGRICDRLWYLSGQHCICSARNMPVDCAAASILVCPARRRSR